MKRLWFEVTMETDTGVLIKQKRKFMEDQKIEWGDKSAEGTSLIPHPIQYINVMIENYSQQLHNIHLASLVILNETEEEEEEE